MEPERKLMGPFCDSGLLGSKELDDWLANSSDWFLNPLLGEFIS